MSSRLSLLSTIVLQVLANHVQLVHSFTIQSTRIHHSKQVCQTRNSTGACTSLKAIEVPSLESLDNKNKNNDSGTFSHEEEGTRLAKSIIGWLDQEWIPQDVHVQMANCVKKTYVQAREDGETEVSTS